MKRSRTSYEALSPLSADFQSQHPAFSAIQQDLASDGQRSEFSEYFNDNLDCTHFLDPLQQFLGSNVETCKAQANTSKQYDFASGSVDGQRSISQAQQSPPQNDEGRPRGIVNYDESPGLIDARHQTRRAVHYSSGAAASPYNMHRRSYSATSQRSALIPMTKPSAATAESTEARPTPYSPYRGHFADSSAARAHRHMSTRFGRQPYIPPEDDHTIEEVERDRNLNVGRIYNAMICGDQAQDNTGSIAMKRWVTGAHYKSDLVEAFAHKVFDCLLVQVKEGFRGWHHNDYVDDDRKGEKEDREADCANRLENIIYALEREKTICEDVVNSASQIRMFVNAPIAYAQRKVQNRAGNSKRGRTKDTADANLRPTQRRRTGGRQMNRSTVTPDRPVSRDTTPQFQTSAPTDLPYYASGSSQQLPSSPARGYLAPRQPLQRTTMSMPQVPPGYRQATATTPPITAQPSMPAATTLLDVMSPPMVPPARPYNAHTTMMPPAEMLPTQMSPLPSTPAPLSYTYHSATPSPGDANRLLTTSSPEDWPTVDTVSTFDTSVCPPVDPSLTTSNLLFTPEAWPSEPRPTDGTNDFDDPLLTTHVSLADIEHTPFQNHVFEAEDRVTDFEGLWNRIPGVQRFSFDELSDGGLNRR